MKKIISILLNNIFKIFKIKSNRIVFEAGRGLVDGNVYAIYDYIKNNCSDKFETIWLVNKDTDITLLNKEDFVYYKTLKSYYYLATAHYWIRNQSLGSIIKKRKGQIYIQLWHGNGGMKHMGYDVHNEKNRVEYDHVKEWDYYIANDELDAKKIVSATGFKGKVEILGMACFDTTLKLVNDNDFKEKVLNELNISKKNWNKQIVLYAPTFRDFDLEKEEINVPIEKLSKLKDKLIFVRLHPLVRKKINMNLFKKSNMINVCDYSNASDLLAICDILITDYSSIFFQYSPLDKPIVFYPYDFEQYVQLRGGFYLNYEKDLPGPICYKEEDLFEVINNIDKYYKKFKTKQNKFNKEHNYCADGKSSKRFVDKLINKEFDEGR